jgi:hypothetical protein
MRIAVPGGGKISFHDPEALALRPGGAAGSPALGHF